MLAGCASPSTRGSPGVRIAAITATNRDAEPHLFDVLVRNDATGDVAFWRRYEAPAARTRQGSDQLRSVGRTTWRTPVSGAGEYVVHAGAADATTATGRSWQTADLTGYDGGWYGVDVVVDRDGRLRLQVYSRSCG